MCTACSNIFTAWCFINSDCAVGLSPSLSISPHHAATKKLLFVPTKLWIHFQWQSKVVDSVDPPPISM
jgi:hypothetical protein